MTNTTNIATLLPVDQETFLKFYGVTNNISSAAKLSKIATSVVYEWLEETEDEGIFRDPDFVARFEAENIKKYSLIEKIVVDLATEGDVKILIRLLDSNLFKDSLYARAEKHPMAEPLAKDIQYILDI